MKKHVVWLLIFSLLCMASCRQAHYREDISCQAITATLCESLGSDEEFLPFGEEQIRFSFENTDRYADQSLVYSARSENIDEIGVFFAKSDEDVPELRRICEQYVETLREEQRAFVASYAPREAVKLDTATVRVFGRYVLYTVLSEEDCRRVLEAMEQTLQGENMQ